MGSMSRKRGGTPARLALPVSLVCLACAGGSSGAQQPETPDGPDLWVDSISRDWRAGGEAFSWNGDCANSFVTECAFGGQNGTFTLGGQFGGKDHAVSFHRSGHSDGTPLGAGEELRYDGHFTDRNTMVLTTSAGATITLSRSGAVVGMVIDGSMKPVGSLNLARKPDPFPPATTDVTGNYILDIFDSPQSPYDVWLSAPTLPTVVYKDLTSGDATLVFDARPPTARDSQTQAPALSDAALDGLGNVVFSWQGIHGHVYLLDVWPSAEAQPSASELRVFTAAFSVALPIVAPGTPGLAAGREYSWAVFDYGPFTPTGVATVFRSDGDSPLVAPPATRSEQRTITP